MGTILWNQLTERHEIQFQGLSLVFGSGMFFICSMKTDICVVCKWLKYQKHKKNHRSVCLIPLWEWISQDILSWGMPGEGQLRQARRNEEGKRTSSHPLARRDNDKSRPHQHLWGMCRDPLQVSTVHINSALMNWGPFPGGLYTCVIRKPGSLTFLCVLCLFLFPCIILLITNVLLVPLEFCSLKGVSQWAESDDSQIVLTQSSSHRRAMLLLYNTVLLKSNCSW